ncbi:hypothetical protein KCTC52924_01663 [Arenibacter antarcticus]|uniref:Cxxc_20_cxxc protein n=1 Tax=Arenibacter antarcticus TaxID=2040469 RepID=A0ABW5VH46_9FLAO|nr:hypothetical protein [Arenibacter sp. H213]MCM4166810.1 hypothetical protein [Arenibacter sp. H213]
MAKEKLVVLKEADLTNNCPECFNQELKLTFYQKHTYGRLFDRTTKDITHEIKCTKCNSLIYPVTWTEDIERVYDYYRRMVAPSKAIIRFTTLFYILILLLISVVATGAYVIIANVI